MSNHNEGNEADMNDSDIINWEDIETGVMRALWHPYILSGAVNLLQGDSTAGKSYLSQAIIAALTTGQALPGAEPMPPCNVIIQNAENSYSHVIKPRLEQLGADFTRIKSINEDEKRLSLMSPAIETTIIKYEAKLFCVDPIQAYMNLYRLETVRETLVSLGQIAERTGCAILLIGHLTKSQSKAQYRGLGRQDIFNAIPSVVNLGKVDDDVRVLVHNKSNFFPVGSPIAFTLKDGFNWIGEYDITLDELLAGDISPQRGRHREKAKEFLQTVLENGELPSVEIYELAESEGISRRTLERAKSELGIRSVQFAGGWAWTLDE